MTRLLALALFAAFHALNWARWVRLGLRMPRIRRVAVPLPRRENESAYRRGPDSQGRRTAHSGDLLDITSETSGAPRGDLG